jgi:hypothetical protein
MEAVRQAAERLASNGYDEVMIFSELLKHHPGASKMMLGSVAADAAKAHGTTEPEPARPPPEPKQYQAPLGPAPVVPPKKTRERYRWIYQPKDRGSIALGPEQRKHTTLVPSDLANMPFLFSGRAGTFPMPDGGTVELSHPLYPYQHRVFVSVLQETQEGGAPCTSGTVNGMYTECYAAETSGRKLYGHVTPGSYGGSGWRRILRSLDQMQEATITTRDADGNVSFSFRLIESVETVAAPSGKRLLIRLGHGLSQRMYAKGGYRGTKPLILEAWRDLRNREPLAYLWVDSICALHDRGSITFDRIVEQLNLKGSAAKRRHQIVQMAEKLNGRLCSSSKAEKAKGNFQPRVLALEVQHNKIVFRAEQVPAQRAA